jgi:CubicO group peptidase (beta-lactamase class C family)
MINRRELMLSGAALALTSLAPTGRASTRAQAVDDAALAAMTATGAKGLAVALIEDGRVVCAQAYGLRNARGDALSADTIMYGASITKAVFAYLVMQLVDEGKVDLDRPIAAMLPQPLPSYGNLDAYGNWGDLADDERWRRITPRHVLTHSTGWANFAFLEPDQKLRFHFDPGARFAYSGEGIILLQFGLEKGLGLKVGDELQRRVFDRFGMPNTSLIWRPAFASNLADGWTIDGKPERHDQRSKVRAAGSMDTTITDLAQFAAGFMRGEGLSAKARAEMLRPQLPITTGSQFPTLQPEAPSDARFKDVSAGLGIVTFRGPQGAGFFKGGHNDSTGNTWVGIERGRRSVLVLGNDVRIEAAFPQLIGTLLGETGAPWRWEYGTQG